MRAHLRLVIGVLVGFLTLVLLGVLGWRASLERTHAGARAAPPVTMSAGIVQPDAEAWGLLVQAIDSIERDERIDELVEQVGDPDGELDAWRALAEPLALAEQAMGRPGLTVPQPDLLADAPMPRIIELLELADAAALRGWQQEDPTLAVRHMAFGAHLGHRLMDGQTWLLLAAVGQAMQDTSVRELGQFVAGFHDEDQPMVRSLIERELGAYTERDPAMPRAIAGECATTEALLQRLADDPELLYQATGQQGVLPPRWATHLVYDAELTIGWHRQHCHAVLAAANSTDTPWPAEPVYWTSGGIPHPGQLLHNPVGRLVLRVVLPSTESLVLRERASRQALADLLAG